MSKFEIKSIQEMYNCKGQLQHFKCYAKNYEVLKGWRFIIYSETEGQELPKWLQSNYDNDFAIIELGAEKRFYYIDEQVYADFLNSKQNMIFMDTCVELDTQVVSYLKKYFLDFDNVKLPKDKELLLLYLCSESVNYSALPYLFENSKKIDSNNFEHCYLNLKSYEMFKNFDYYEYKKSGNIKYYKEKSDILIEVDKTFSMIKSREFQEQFQDLYNVRDAIYCLLLKAIIVENVNSKKSEKNKMKILCEFVNNKLGVVMEREMAICYYYFMHDESTHKFFKKTKVNSKNILETIGGMAWDLTHLRLLERLYTFFPVDNLKFAIHPLVTYDNGLKEVARLYPIKMIAFNDKEVHVCFKKNFLEIYPDAINTLYTEELIQHRRKNFNMDKIKYLIKELENEIISINGC